MREDLTLIWEQYKTVTEGRVGDAIKVGAMAATSLLGSPSMSDAQQQGRMDTTTQQTQQQTQVIPNEDIVRLWGAIYQTQKDPKKMQRAREVLHGNYSVPSIAEGPINTAVYIFGGDEGVSSNVLEDLLRATGAIESGYRTRVQYRGGPARGFWQVEPNTAVNLLIHSTAYFGPKFRRTFGEDADRLLAIRSNNAETRAIVGQMILDDDNLAAAFAAAWWISSAKEKRMIHHLQ